MKKKIMFIAIPLVLIILAIIAYFMFVSNTGKYVDKSIDMIREGIAYIGQRKYGTSGELKVTAKYKGAHGEHYPKDFSYIFETRIEDEKYKVSIGNENGFVTKEYNIELVSMINDLKEVNTTKLDYVTYKKEKDYYKLDVDVINDALKTNYKTCTMKIETEGIFKTFKSSTLKCDDNLTIKLEENKAIINYYDNKIKIDTNETGFSLNMNDSLKMNAFYEENKNRYSIVIDQDVYYLETTDEGIYLTSSSQAAIYNAMEARVTYKNLVLNKVNSIPETEIPIFRYFNEFEYTFWRNINE